MVVEKVLDSRVLNQRTFTDPILRHPTPLQPDGKCVVLSARGSGWYVAHISHSSTLIIYRTVPDCANHELAGISIHCAWGVVC